MRDKCVRAVERAVGRTITEKEAKGIEERLSKWMHLEAKRDPATWSKLSEAQRLAVSSQQAIKEIAFEAARDKKILELQIQAHDRLTRQTGQWQGGRLDALKRLTAAVTDGKGSFRSVETLGRSIADDALSKLTETYEALDPRVLGLFENAEGVRDFTRALFGESKGIDPKIVKAADEWKRVAEGLRSQFNEAGGKIGRLEDWALPQHHSQLKVAQAKVDQWVADVLPRLDRSKYVRDDGRAMDDAEVQAFLREAWRSIATDGLNDMEPGANGQAMLANRRAAHREIHFKDAEAYRGYQDKYGDKGLLAIMTEHLRGISRDIAAIETFGPNADRTFEYFRDLGLKEAANTDPEHVGRYQDMAHDLTGLWQEVRGVPGPIGSKRLARAFDWLRNWMVSTRLGSAVITSISDEGTMHATARLNGLSYMHVFGNELRAMNLADGEELRQARRAGLALETMIGDLNRFGQESLAHTLPAKLAALTMRVSGLSAITDARRRAFGTTMMDAIGSLTRKTESLYRLDADDHKILLSKGITDTDWQVWRAATPEKWGSMNDTVLTPASIHAIPDAALEHLIGDLEVRSTPGSEAYRAAVGKIRRDAALKLLGAVGEEVDMAVVTPKALERAQISRWGAGARGTWKGELTRSVFLFKTTPLAVVQRHLGRGMAQDSGLARAAYIGSFIASTTLLGAFAMQLKELIAGRDPKNLNPMADGGVRNWVAAFLQGGSLGLYGDFLFSGTTQHQTSPTAAFLGPTIGGLEEFFNLTQGNLVQLAQGNKTNAGAELIRFAKSNIPVIGNLWYTKAVLDHLIVHNLQEMMSPGYLASYERKMQRQFGQSFYWTPGEATPARGPDFGRIVGQ